MYSSFLLLLISESSKRFINEYFSSEVKFLSLFMIEKVYCMADFILCSFIQNPF